jgi:hypothetical protein
VTTVEWIVRGTVDDAAVEEHVAARPDRYPLVADASEWTWDDLTAAVDEEFATDLEITGFLVGEEA